MNKKIYILQINSDVVQCLSNLTLAHKYLLKVVKLYDKIEAPAYMTVSRAIEEKNTYELFYQHPGSDQAIRFKIILFLLRTNMEAAKHQKEFAFMKQYRLDHKFKINLP